MKRIERDAEYTVNIGKSRVATGQPTKGRGASSNETKPLNPLGDIGENGLGSMIGGRREQLEAWMRNAGG